MTKNWEAHEAKIRELYAKHTLKTVREIMLKDHKFDASEGKRVRAYRQKLDEWGMTKYKPRDNKNKARNSPGEESSRTQATTPHQQYIPDSGPSNRAEYDSPVDTMVASGQTQWPPSHQSGYNVPGWPQQSSYTDPQMMHQTYDHQSTMETNTMGQQSQWYGNYSSYDQVPGSSYYNTTTMTSPTSTNWSYSQPPANTSMTAYQTNVDEEHPEQQDEYPDSNEGSPTNE
ncbi:hypothetical protein E8E14_005736 [Neopestalotiopsis sp. 37M]|nr:hypothetical protein E8E14_005736 [Neopestalotiopsis sp. 37M]